MNDAEKLIAAGFRQRYRGHLSFWEVGFVLAVSDGKAKVKADIDKAVTETALGCGVRPERVVAVLRKAHEEDYWNG